MVSKVVRASSLGIPLALLLALRLGASAYGQPVHTGGSAASPAGKAGTEPVLYLKQVSDMDSRFDVYVKPDAVLVDCVSEHYRIIARAPDWRVTIWNLQRRIITSVSFDDWCHRYEMQGTSWTTELRNPLKVQNYNEKGQRCHRYFYGSIAPVGCFLKTDIGSGDNKPEVNHSEVVVLDRVNGDKIGAVYGRLRGLPVLPGLPLSAIRYRPKVTDKALEIVSRQDMPVPASMFEVPKNFKQVRFSSNILVGNERIERIRGLADEMAR